MKFSNDVLEQVSAKIRMDYMEMVRAIDPSSLSYDKHDTVTLYHGTTSGYLNGIIRTGILPRRDTGIDNWQEALSSIENVTYLTNKWHYSYAIHAHIKYAEEHDVPTESEVKLRNSFPCYVECKVPKGLLVMDEDYFHTSNFLQKLKSHLKKHPDMHYMELPNLFDPMECLAQYGTVGVLGTIPPSMITSFTVLGDESLYQYLIDPSSPYVRDWERWRQGKGKGKLKLRSLLEKEAESDLNGTWFMQQVKKNTIVSFGLNPSTGKLAMVQR